MIATSYMWNDEIDLIARFHAEYGTDVEEMETAAAAQTAASLGVPFLGIRIVSDNATNGIPYNPKPARPARTTFAKWRRRTSPRSRGEPADATPDK